MRVKYYNIHDIVKFKIVDKTSFKWYASNIYSQYKNFEMKKTDKQDFIVYLGSFIPSNQDCVITDNNYYFKEDYFYCRQDSYKLTKWGFEMKGFEGNNTIVSISSNLLGYLYMSGFIIDFLIHFKMNQKGYPLVHASCISHDNHGIMITARGGGGKTTIALSFVENGFKLLGDNFIVVHDNQVLSFLSPLNIFTYNLTPLIKRNFGVKNKIFFDLKYLFYKLTLGYIKLFTMVNPKDIFPNSVTNNSQLDGIFLIIPKDGLKVEKINRDKIVDHLVINQKLDFRYFLKYTSEYSYAFPKSNLSLHWNRYEKNLRKNLPINIPAYKILVPQKYNTSVLEEIMEVMQNETNIKL